MVFLSLKIPPFLKQEVKTELHPRNRHRRRYDFPRLVEGFPALAFFVIKNTYGEESIDFSNPSAVKALNQAILKCFYSISWDIPSGYLCPPIPGRADYIHHIADLLSTSKKKGSSKDKTTRILDVGTGANCIYPLIGYREYGWKFLGSDVDPTALSSARKIVQSNGLSNEIELTLQESSLHIFKGVLGEDQRVDISMCNPPFHTSLKEARQGTRRKWKNLGINPSSALNFGGKQSELWCPGGEVGFVRRMIQESVDVQEQCSWFSTLISKGSHLQDIYLELKKVGAIDIRTIDMAQGQKKSRIIAWTFDGIF